MLLKLEEYRQALIKALESGDTDQAYKVILKSRDKMSNIDFKGMLQEFPVALSLYIKFCREYNSVSLRDILKLPDDHNALGLLSVIESLDKEVRRTLLLTISITIYYFREDLIKMRYFGLQSIPIKHQEMTFACRYVMTN